jgi:hypothetical protein
MSNIPDPRLRHLSAHLHQLGPRSFFEYLKEILNGEDPEELLERYARLAFGRARGVIEEVCGALGVPIVFITPPMWKRLADIPPGAEHKDLARTRAIARWPQHAELFARKCDVDRAEAALIAVAGLLREARHF